MKRQLAPLGLIATMHIVDIIRMGKFFGQALPHPIVAPNVSTSKEMVW